jgi:hydrogenase small subunit/[NiFe] hydrogenase small subunit
MTPFYERLPGVTLPMAGGAVEGANSAGKKILGITAAAVGIHAAVGIGKKIISGGKSKTTEQE